MSFFSRIRAFLSFKKSSKREEPSPPDSLKQIKIAMEILRKKSDSLSDSFKEEKLFLSRLNEVVRSIKKEDNPTAIKFEQDILEKITSASADCSKAIITNSNEELKKSLRSLDFSIKQRCAFKEED